MIHVTPRALEMLDTVLMNIRGQLPVLPSDQAAPLLRLVVEPNAVGLAMDVPAPEDQVIERDGHQVLLVGDDVSLFLDGATIDAVDTPDGVRLAIRGPETLEPPPNGAPHFAE